jgi:hypothetical protein
MRINIGEMMAKKAFLLPDLKALAGEEYCTFSLPG